MNIKYFNFRKRAEELYSKGNLEEAYVLFNKALDFADEKEQIEILYFQALINDELENFRESNNKFFEIYRLDKNQPAAIYGIAMSYEKMKNYEKAEKYYLLCIDKNPNYDRAYFFLANLYDYQERFDEAIEKYKKTVELDPLDYMAYNNMGAIFENTNRFDEALSSLNMAIEIEPYYFRPYFNKGVVLGRLKKFKEAIEQYNIAKELNPSYCNIYLNISALYIEKSMHRNSIKILNEGIKSACDSKANLYYNQSCSYMKLGEIELSMNDLRKSISLNEDLREFALKDEDFQGIKEEKIFIELVGE